MSVLSARLSAATAQRPVPDPHGMVRVLTCGSVDDGKSTLIGRLLWDASDLFDDERDTLRRSPRRVLDGTHLDYSLLVDGLLAEREQGITIDVAWRYFEAAGRRFVIIDSPGHEQYTRNMASGASHADIAVMLVDARQGIKLQTRRHAAILDLFGVRRIVLAVNKMDLVGWSKARFGQIELDFRSLFRRFRFEQAAAIPVAAVTGDNVARRSEAMPWYAGPTLLEQLGRSPGLRGRAEAFRMPVQTALRDGQDFRGLAGTITSGQVSVGDHVCDALSGHSARIARITTMTCDLATATRGQAVALVLDRDIDLSRGSVLASPKAPPIAARRLEVRLVWLADSAFDPKIGYQLRTATDLVALSSVAIQTRLDLETLTLRRAASCATNDVIAASLVLARPVAVDPFADHPETGSFVLVDPVTGATVAGGVISNPLGSSASTERRSTEGKTFRLTRDTLLRGVCADLAGRPGDQAEFARRAVAVADLLRQAGVDVTLGDLDLPGDA